MKLHQLLTIIAVCSIGTAAADTYTVTNTEPSGVGSLFQAVFDANAHPNIDVNTPDVITFDIPSTDPNRNPATGVFSIALLAPGLPIITDPVVIDGYTQDGATANTLATGSDAALLVELNGIDAMGGFAGLDFQTGSDGSTVRGLIVNRCTTGVSIDVSNVKVLGNFIGTDSAGAASLGNGSGVVSSGPGGNQIGSPAPADRNVISGNGNGVVLTNHSSDTNTVQNNYLGVNADGNAAIANSESGIFLTAGDTDGATLIGGEMATPTSGEGNVISGSGGSGIFFNVGSGFLGLVTIQGNLIGLGADGTTRIANGGSGIEDITEPGSTNGTLLIRQNIISGNGADGILYASTNTTVQGNFIGTDITGVLDRGNIAFGLEIAGDRRDVDDPGATDITIGGTAAGDGNVISGNELGGISIQTADAVIEGNLIGTQADGISALGNGAEGIQVHNISADSVLRVEVGGILDGAGNTIAHNAGGGVFVEASNVPILRNSIFGNEPGDAANHPGLGIDLGDPGVTPNDPLDADEGPNGLQNFPVLTSAGLAGENAEIIGVLDSRPSTPYRLEFFGNDALDPSGYGEGKTFLGTAQVTTDANGHASFDLSFPLAPGALRPTATATDPDGNTSEFSGSIGSSQNISTRGLVQTGDNVMIGGFIVTGADPKRIMVRAIGPSLTAFGLAGALADPTLELHGSDGALLASNDNWKSDQQVEIEATMIAPTDDLEAAIIATLPANGAAYTAILRGKNEMSGLALVEAAYDLDAGANSKLANISTRGFVGTGDNVLIGGFILDGAHAQVLVRALGPSLAAFGVGGVLEDPTLDLHDANGVLILTNDNWKSDQQVEIEATMIPPSDDLEAAIVATLPGGSYTAVLRGKNESSGVALVEIYNLN